MRAVVLTGTGRAFCAGQDLGARRRAARRRPGDSESSFALGNTVLDHYNPIATLVATMHKPVVAALNGVAAGAGASFAFAADVRLVAERAGINTAFVAIALSCDTGSSWWLPRLVGTARAKDLLLFPRTVPAQECLSSASRPRSCPPTSWPHRRGGRPQLAAGPTLAYGSIRRAVDFGGHTWRRRWSTRPR